MSYRESPTTVAQAVFWQRRTGPAVKPMLILPDGCLDLIWDGNRLFVAGPDSTARWHQSSATARYSALRFAGGLGPAAVGVPADELRDQTIELAQVCPARSTRILADRLAADPARALQEWLADRLTNQPLDALGPRVLALAEAGLPVATMAERLGVSERQLHRRCLPLFGYGARHLSRIMRLNRAVDATRSGTPLAEVAAQSGYCDQAHLTREFRALTGQTPGALR